MPQDIPVQGWQLAQRQGLPLELKIRRTERRITMWYEHFAGDVYVAFSGGRDSTVLLHLVRKQYPNVEAVFFDTGVEFPEIRRFVRTIDNVTWVRPAMPFHKVLQRHGYPIVSKQQAEYLHEIRDAKSRKVQDYRLNGNARGNFKLSNKWRYLLEAPFPISHHCCDVLKKNPAHKAERQSGKARIIGTMAIDSNPRKLAYLKSGCNALNLKSPRSTPIAFWTHADIIDYIESRQLELSSIYSMGYEHTGCAMCLFGLHMEKPPNRLEMLAQTHPKMYQYVMKTLHYDDVLEWYPELTAKGKLQSRPFELVKP